MGNQKFIMLDDSSSKVAIIFCVVIVSVITIVVLTIVLVERTL